MASGYSCESESGSEQVVRVKVVYTTPALNIAADITPGFQYLHGGGGVPGLPTSRTVRVALVLPMAPRKLNFACKTAVPWNRLPPLPLLPVHVPSAQHR